MKKLIFTLAVFFLPIAGHGIMAIPGKLFFQANASLLKLDPRSDRSADLFISGIINNAAG